MFPIERKNEFLKYVMITEPYDKWSHVVYGYIIDNNIKNWKKGFDFVVKYADDPSGDAYYLVKDGYAEPNWARKVIENATIGNPLGAAYLMVRYELAKPEWARKVIENAVSGDPSGFAYLMVRYGHATQEWYKEIKRKNDVSS